MVAGVCAVHTFFQIDLPVLREQSGEGALFGELATGVVLGLESIDLPFVYVVRVPGFLFLMPIVC